MRFVATTPVIARSVATKQSSLSLWFWIASLALAMTANTPSHYHPQTGIIHASTQEASDVLDQSIHRHRRRGRYRGD